MHRDELLRRLDRAGLVSHDRARSILQDRAHADRPPTEVLVETGLVSEEALARLIAQAYRVPFVVLAEHDLSADVVRAVPRDVAENYNLLPIEREGDVMTLAMADPLDLMAEDLVRFMTSCQIRRVMATASELKEAREALYEGRPWPSFGDSSGRAAAGEGAPDESPAPAGPPPQEPEPPAVPQEAPAPPPPAPAVPAGPGRAVEVLLEAAQARVPEVHFEPGEGGLVVRFRTGGRLRRVAELGSEERGAVLAELRRMMGASPADWKRPRSGWSSLRSLGADLDLQLTSLPTLYGQKVVVRLVERARHAPDLERLGLLPEAYRRVEGLLEKPSGLVLVTGPAGSGRTSTLYAMLRHLEPSGRSLVVLEDTWLPDLGHVTCVPFGAESGLELPEAVQAALLQGPDVLLLRRIPDAATAELVVRAAGEALVLASLASDHSVDAARRLVRMVSSPVQAAGALLGVVAQRRVRRVCEQCLEATTEAPRDPRLPLGLQLPERLYRGRGCPECGHSGFRDTLVLHEVLRVTDGVRDLLWSDASAQRVQAAAHQDGMVSLLEDGLAKAGMGFTSVQEVLRMVPAAVAGQRLCPGCRNLMEEEFRTCPWCGPGLDQLCPSCRRPVESGWITCPYCRFALRYDSAEEVEATQEDLPAQRPSSGEREALPRAPGPRKVLVADHDAASRAFFLDALERAGYQAILADDGVDAVDLVEHERPDLILAALKLPKVDGLEISRKVRDADLGIPVFILHSEPPDAELQERLEEVGILGVLTRAEGLVGCLRRIAEVLEAAPVLVEEDPSGATGRG